MRVSLIPSQPDMAIRHLIVTSLTSLSLIDLRFRLAKITTALLTAEEEEWEYTPLRDGESQQSLESVLPDYFCEGITFSGNQLPNFFAKMTQCLNEFDIVQAGKS